MRSEGVMEPEQDTGYAWVILFAVTLWNFILGGTMKIYGMLYIEFVDMLGSSPAKVGLIGLVCGIMSIFISPGAGRLSDRHPSRIQPLCGAVIATLAMALTGQTTSLIGAVFSYGVLFGISLGLSDGPVLSMVGKYFTKRRNFAYGVAFAGSSVGHVALAYLMAISIDYYTIRGAMLVLAGVWAQTCILTMLLRPKKFPTIIDGDKLMSSSPDEDSGPLSSPSNQPEKEIDSNDNKTRDIKSESENNTCDTKCDINKCGLPHNCNNVYDRCTDDTHESIPDICDTHEAHLNKNMTCVSDNIFFTNSKNSAEIVVALDIENTKTNKASLKTSDETDDYPMVIVNDIDDNEEHDQLRTEKTSLTSTSEEDYVKCVSSQERGSTNCSDSCCCPLSTKCPSLMGVLLDRAARSSYLSFLRQESMWSALLLLGCGMFGYFTLITAMPAYLEELGLDRRHTAWFMFALGLGEILAYLLITFSVDHFRWSATFVLWSSMLVSGIGCLLLVIRPTYTLIVTYGAVHGSLGGLSLVLMSSLMVEAAGVENLGSSMGLAVMQLNITSTLTSIVAGAVFEVSGSYANAIRLSGAVYLFGCTIYGLRTIIYRKCREHKRQVSS